VEKRGFAENGEETDIFWEGGEGGEGEEEEKEKEPGEDNDANMRDN